MHALLDDCGVKKKSHSLLDIYEQPLIRNVTGIGSLPKYL